MDFRVWNGPAHRKTLVVLGAGASRGASFVRDDRYEARPPLDSDFFSEMQRIKQASDVKEDVDGLLRFVRKEFGFNLTLSMEHFFSHVEAADRFHEEVKIDSGPKIRSYRQALQKFHRSLPILFKRAIGNNNCEYHERLVSRLLPEDVILSFNYDCLIDAALYKHPKKLWNPAEGYGFTAQVNAKSSHAKMGRIRSPKKSITLLKPHGSLNWDGVPAGQVSLTANPYNIKTAEGRIIPPTWFKSVKEYPYEDVWKRTRREIRECRALIVIGYSIPPTDLFSRLLFRIDVNSIEFLVIANPIFSDRQKFIDLIDGNTKANLRVVEFDNLEKLANSLS